MKIKFYGVRGSIPAPSTKRFKTEEYGGNTSCLEVVGDNGEEYIFDCGTGLRLLGMDLLKKSAGKPITAKIFFSHVHWDHIQGWPFFVPAFIKGNSFALYGEKKVNRNLEDTLKGQQQYPNFPVSLDKMGANIQFYDLNEGTTIDNGVEIGFINLNHPDGIFSYKVTENGKAFVYATDTEHDGHKFNTRFGPTDRKLIEWARNADILVYDGQYTPKEYETKKSWGHSTPEMGVDIALEAGVKKLVLTHHDPSHDDAFLDKMHDAVLDYSGKQPNNHGLMILFAREELELRL